MARRASGGRRAGEMGSPGSPTLARVARAPGKGPLMLRLPDHWVWDFWHVRDEDGRHHLFHLQAPRSIGDPELRHWHVTIGHAVSDDLRSWEHLGTCFGPGEPGAWDDYTTWTGSVIRTNGRWAMLYTGTNRAEDAKVQRVGLAWSDDLHNWERHPDPVLEAEAPHYELLDLDAWHDQAWRDPWVIEEDGRYHCWVTARAPVGPPRGRGVIGHAISDDLVSWKLQPPASQPVGFGQLEVPQLVPVGDRWAMLFCSDVETQDVSIHDQVPGTGTYYLLGDEPTGPFRGAPAEVLSADHAATSYAGRIVDSDEGPQFLSWLRDDAHGGFVGEISDPRPVLIGEDGRLRLG